MDSTPMRNDTPIAQKRVMTCKFFYSPRGCRDGDDCLYMHSSNAPKCKYFFSKWGCWNGKYCRFKHEESTKEEDTSKEFYADLNQWLGATKRKLSSTSQAPQLADDSILSCISEVTCEETPSAPKPSKKFVTRGTQTKTAPDFVHCGECGEEFKSCRNLQQSLERHYIHKMASADFHHLRFFKRHSELNRQDPFCAACGQVFVSVEGLLQHMGSKISLSTTSGSVRQEHQYWFKQLVNPFVYRDLEVLDTEEEMIQRILDVYFVKSKSVSRQTSTSKEQPKPAPSKGSPLARKLQVEANTASPYIHCVECGEIFDDPDGDVKLHNHYVDMLTRADGLHVWLLREKVDTQAQCSVCKKIFLSAVALLQHAGSKQTVTASTTSQSATRHADLLSQIADVFVGRDLGVEGFTKDTIGDKILEAIKPVDDCHPNEVATSGEDVVNDSAFKEAPDESLQMARYFCRVNEWQGKMNYPEYVRDDQERTRNSGFTVAEVEYLATKGFTPTSRGVFTVLNTLYRRRKHPLRSVRKKPAKVQPVKEEATPQQAAEGNKDQGGAKEQDEDETEQDGEPEGEADDSISKGPPGKPKRKRVRRRRRSKGGASKQDEESSVPENKKPSAGQGEPASKNIADKSKKGGAADVEESMAAPRVFFQVHIDGTVFIRPWPVEEEEEEKEQSPATCGKHDLALEKAVGTSLHAAEKSVEMRIFVVHKDGTVDVTIRGSDASTSNASPGQDGASDGHQVTEKVSELTAPSDKKTGEAGLISGAAVEVEAKGKEIVSQETKMATCTTQEVAQSKDSVAECKEECSAEKAKSSASPAAPEANQTRSYSDAIRANLSDKKDVDKEKEPARPSIGNGEKIGSEHSEERGLEQAPAKEVADTEIAESRPSLDEISDEKKSKPTPPDQIGDEKKSKPTAEINNNSGTGCTISSSV